MSSSATPVLVVLTSTDAFSGIWKDLAAEVRAELRADQSLAELGAIDDACAVLIAAGGDEAGALDLVEEVVSISTSAVAVVGATTDHQIAFSLGRGGATRYFALPQDLELLRSWLEEQVDRFTARQRAAEVAAVERQRFDFSRMIGESPALLTALEYAARVIPRGSATVLITGETGTGKELLAEAIHYNSPRARHQFVDINCTALPETLLEAELFGYEKGAFTDARSAKPGLFEVANGGTLFLDEIGDLSLPLQAKLLKVLESKQVRRLGAVRTNTMDVRIVAATHVDLAAASRAGRFRQDLYHRLRVVPIHLPPLRDRGHDVLLLTEAFVEQFAREYDVPRPPLTAELRSAIVAHPWPGNIRELRNSVERAVLLGAGRLLPEHLFLDGGDSPEPASATGPLPFPATLGAIERAAVLAMLERYDGNKTAAADALGISRVRLYRLLQADRP